MSGCASRTDHLSHWRMLAVASSCFLPVVVVAMGLVGSPASADILFSSAASNDAGIYTGSFVDVDSGLWRAQSFSTGSQGWNVTEVFVYAGPAYGNYDPTFALRLRDGTSGVPGAVAATVFDGTLSSYYAIDMTFSSLDIDLSANSSYFLSLEPSPDSYFLWLSVTGLSEASASSTNSGASWVTTTSSQLWMEIRGATIASVPEIDPSGAGSVLALLSASWAMLERRRSRPVA